jgi:hypothetical protein
MGEPEKQDVTPDDVGAIMRAAVLKDATVEELIEELAGRGKTVICFVQFEDGGDRARWKGNVGQLALALRALALEMAQRVRTACGCCICRLAIRKMLDAADDAAEISRN